MVKLAVEDPAVLLAALRASGGLSVQDVSAETFRIIARIAEASGRMLADCSVTEPASPGRAHAARRPVRGAILRWMPQCTPSPEDSQAYLVRVLPPISRLTWACCLGLAWPQRSDDLYPGARFTRAAVVDTAADLGAGATWVKAAVDHDLLPAGLIMADPSGGQGALRLGPAAAALPEPFIEAMRRFHEQLPRPASGQRADDDSADEASSEDC